MALIRSPNHLGQLPTPGIFDTSGCIHRVEHTLVSAPALNDVLVLAEIPPDAMLYDWALDADKLDSNGTPTIAMKAGILNAGLTDLDTGNNIFKTGITIAQQGGIQRMDTLAPMRIGASSARRWFGVVFTTAAATFTLANGGKIGITLQMAPSRP